MQVPKEQRLKHACRTSPWKTSMDPLPGLESGRTLHPNLIQTTRLIEFVNEHAAPMGLRTLLLAATGQEHITSYYNRNAVKLLFFECLLECWNVAV